MIRNFLKGIIPLEKIKNAYVPEILGKEKRKDVPSKEGLLGVEGMELSVLKVAIQRSGATILGEEVLEKEKNITKSDLYDLGLSGRENSKALRDHLLSSLDLPKYLSTNAMLDALNCLFTKEEFEAYLDQIDESP